MRLALPYTLPRDQLRQRLHERSGEIAGLVPAGLGTVRTEWRDEDHLGVTIGVFGQTITGTLEIAETELVVTLDLPPGLSMMAPMMEGQITSKLRALLA